MTNILQRFVQKNPLTGDALKILTHYRHFKKMYKFLKESYTWSEEQIREYQTQQLRKLLHHAYKNVPYYAKLFDKLKLKPKDISSVEDLQKLPLLDKQTVRENLEEFKAKNFPKRKFEYITTGGSTGFPLGLYVERGVAEAIHMAFLQILLDQVDCHFTDRQVHIIGIEEACKYQVFGRILILSSFHMKDENMPTFIRKIRKLKPKFILGFPSAVTILARYMNKNKIEPFSSVKTVICSGETLYDWQRELLEETFKCRVHAVYSHNEVSVFATTCAYSNDYHIYPEYGIAELIHKDGKPVTKEGEMGEIVVTGFNNPLFPLIRYRTGDIGVLAHQKCKCGRNYLLLKRIEGRVQDFIVSKSGRYIPLTGFYGLVAKCSNNVRNCQLVQEVEGEVILNIVKDKGYTDEDENSIVRAFEKRFGGEVDLIIRYVDQIPLTSGGKFKFLIQKLPIDY